MPFRHLFMHFHVTNQPKKERHKEFLAIFVRLNYLSEIQGCTDLDSVF